MPFSDLKLVLLHDVEWSLNASGVRAELNLTLREVPDDRDFSFDLTVSSQVLEIGKQSISVASQTDPVSVDEHFGHPFIAQVLRRQLLKLLHTPVLQLVDDVS